ncbi:MAG: hypothetical protein K2P39_00695, partial [Lachnospiraceae bacterium]|nr:hypothetical protein [Lachnospiraceae bacterium]
MNNTNHIIILKKEIFNLQSDIRLSMEIVDGRWFFVESDSYELQNSITKTSYFNQELQNQDLLSVGIPG